MGLRTLIILTMVALSAFGQKEHLSFMGIPITGETNDFVKNLKKQGFKPCTRTRFIDYQAKTLRGDWWWFEGCKVSIRKHKAGKGVSSVYIHPTSGYTKIYDLIDAYDKKYGEHLEYVDPLNGRDFCMTWTLENGAIQVYGSFIFGQAFNIVYRNFSELVLLHSIEKYMDSEL